MSRLSEVSMRFANPHLPVKPATREILPLISLAAAITRLHESSTPIATPTNSVLAPIFLPLLQLVTPPPWVRFRTKLEKVFGTKKKIKKDKIQAGELGISLVLDLFQKLTVDMVRDCHGDITQWIERIIKAIEIQSAAHEIPFTLPAFDELRLGKSSPFTEANPRPTNPSIIANFPPTVLALILEAMFLDRYSRDTVLEPPAVASDIQTNRYIFQRVCYAWSLIPGRAELAVTGLVQTMRLTLALKSRTAGKSGKEIKGLMIDLRKTPKAMFEGCGKALASLFTECSDLQRLELLLPGPGVEGEEVVGLASLALAFNYTTRLKRLILRVIPETKRMRNGERKVAAPLSLRLSILSPVICRLGLEHFEAHGIVIVKARLAGKIECRLSSFKSSWQGDNSSLLALLTGSRSSLTSLTLLCCYTNDPFSRVDLANFLISVGPTLKRLAIIECVKDLVDPLYLETTVPHLTTLTHLTLGTTGYTNQLFAVLPDSVQHLSLELTKQLLPPPGSAPWKICEFLKEGKSKNFKSLAIVPEPTAKVVLGNGSVWKLGRNAEKGGVDLILPAGWRL